MEWNLEPHGCHCALILCNCVSFEDGLPVVQTGPSSESSSKVWKLRTWKAISGVCQSRSVQVFSSSHARISLATLAKRRRRESTRKFWSLVRQSKSSCSRSSKMGQARSRSIAQKNLDNDRPPPPTRSSASTPTLTNSKVSGMFCGRVLRSARRQEWS